MLKIINNCRDKLSFVDFNGFKLTSHLLTTIYFSQ